MSLLSLPRYGVERPRIQLGWGVVPAVGAALLLGYPLVADDQFYQNMIILAMLLAIGAVGLNVISGFCGYVSIGHSVFLGAGAYTVGLLSLHAEISPFVFVPLAGVVAAIFALPLAGVAMRSRGHSFAIVTIAFLFLVQLVATNWASLTQGSTGISLPLPQWDSAYALWPFYYSFAALLVLSLLMSWWIRRTRFGLGLLAIREDEDKAATLGISTPLYKLLGVIASGFFVGMAGGVYAYYVTFIDPRGMFNILISTQMLLAMLLGGRATLWGPVLGAFMIEPLNEFVNLELGGGNYRLLIFGGALALVVLFLPDGVIPALRKLIEKRRSHGRAGRVGMRLAGRADLKSVDFNRVAHGQKLLEVRGLEKRFGGVHALSGASFEVPPGSITALIGPNGSGKTTAFNLIDGTMAPSAGEISFEGRRLNRVKPWARAHLGIGRTFQVTRVFPEMTVLENIVAPIQSFSWRQLNAAAVGGKEAARAEELLEFVGMAEFRDQRAAELSFGQQKLVELAQVLMLDPKLIMLDEPAGGINPTLIDRIADMIRELNGRGKTFLVVEHNMPLVLDLCDPVLVLANGRCISKGTPDEIQQDAAVLDAYLGEDFNIEEPVGV